MPKSAKTNHVRLQFFTRWDVEHIQKVGELIATYLASFKMEGITIVSHVFDAALRGKTQLVVKIKVRGTNATHTITEFAKRVILDLKAVPAYNQSYAHA